MCGHGQVARGRVHVYTPSPVSACNGFPGGSGSKESACNAGDLGLIPGLGSSLGEGNGNLLQYSWLENPMDRGAWRAAVHGVAESDMTDCACTHVCPGEWGRLCQAHRAGREQELSLGKMLMVISELILHTPLSCRFSK